MVKLMPTVVTTPGGRLYIKLHIMDIMRFAKFFYKTVPNYTKKIILGLPHCM